MEKQLIGIVLCGGKSSRMGTDKGMMSVNGTTWAASMAQKLEQIRVPVYFSINQSQVEAYSKIFNRDRLIVDNVNISGPLRGLISSWNRFRDSDLFVVACDMLDLQFKTLLDLYEVYHDFKTMPSKKSKEFFVYENKNHVEPMCAILTNKGLHKIARIIEKGKLSDHSMRNVLTIAGTHAIPIPDDLQIEFRNYNTPVDI